LFCPGRDAFGGDSYEPEFDFRRLKTQLERVRFVMTSPCGYWWTLAEIAKEVDGSEAGISARIRDLRKAKNGGFEVERRRVRGGLFEYRVVSAEEMALRMVDTLKKGVAGTT